MYYIQEIELTFDGQANTAILRPGMYEPLDLPSIEEFVIDLDECDKVELKLCGDITGMASKIYWDDEEAAWIPLVIKEAV